MTIEPDAVEQILNQHDKQLEKHDTRISKLEETNTKILVAQAEASVKLSNIEVGQIDLKNSFKEVIEKIDEINKNDNKDKNEIIKDNQNKLWELIFKGLALIGVALGVGNSIK